MSGNLSLFSAPLLLFMTAVPLASAQNEPPSLPSFTINEAFGVSHPVQIIDFDLPVPVDAAQTKLLGPDGNEVSYQLIGDGKKIALQSDLPANATLTWKLAAGKPAARDENLVRTIKTIDYYEIINGLTGIRVPLPVENPAPTPAANQRHWSIHDIDSAASKRREAARPPSDPRRQQCVHHRRGRNDPCRSGILRLCQRSSTRADRLR